LTTYRVADWREFLEKSSSATLRVYWENGETFTARAVFSSGDSLECGVTERWSHDIVKYYVGSTCIPVEDFAAKRSGLMVDLRIFGFIKVAPPG